MSHESADLARRGSPDPAADDLARRGSPDPAVPDDRRSPVPPSDSPWFWFGLFAAMAIIALVVVGPKFATRQSKLQQNYEGRRDAWQRSVAPAPADQPAPSRPGSTAR